VELWRDRLGGLIAACLAGAAMALSACGGASDDEQIKSAAANLQAAFADGDLKRVCDLMTANAQRHVKGLGHKSPEPVTCAGQLRMIAGGLRKQRRRVGGRDPRIAAVAVDGSRAVATIQPAGGPATDVPFAREGDEWKVDALYGGMPAGRQEDRF
jgi:hypothetical protein